MAAAAALLIDEPGKKNSVAKIVQSQPNTPLAAPQVASHLQLAWYSLRTFGINFGFQKPEEGLPQPAATDSSSRHTLDTRSSQRGLPIKLEPIVCCSLQKSRSPTAPPRNLLAADAAAAAARLPATSSPPQAAAVGEADARAAELDARCYSRRVVHEAHSVVYKRRLQQLCARCNPFTMSIAADFEKVRCRPNAQFARQPHSCVSAPSSLGTPPPKRMPQTRRSS